MKFKNGFFVIGTDTDIGKTYISTLLYKSLKKYDAYYFKVVQSGCIKKGDQLIAPDVDFLCNFNNIEYDDSMVGCRLAEEVSPHLAAELENKEINIDLIFEKINNLKNKYTNIIFEGAGGLYVPLIRNKFYIYDLIKKLNVPVILVCSTKVGSINHSMLTIEALRNMNIEIYGLIFNNFTGKLYEMDNIKNITEMSKIDNFLIVKKNQQDIEEKDFKYFFGGVLNE